MTDSVSLEQVRNQAARKGGLDVSLFKRLSDAHPAAVVYLTSQYRMNDHIMLLSNRLVYQNRLVVGNEQVARRMLDLPGWQSTTAVPRWLRDVLDPE